MSEATNPAVEAPSQSAAPAAEPAKGQEPAKSGATDAPAIVYAETGDAGLDAAHRFLAKAGIAEDSPAYQAALQGNFDMLTMELSQSGLPGWEQAVELGKKSYEAAKSKGEANVKAVGEAVMQVAEQAGVDWEETVKWARDNGTDEEKAELNKLMGSPFTAKIAAHWLTSMYANAHGTEKAPASAVNSDAPASMAKPNGGPLSRVEFAKEAEKLHKAKGDDYQSSPEYAALWRRRQAG